MAKRRGDDKLANFTDYRQTTTQIKASPLSLDLSFWKRHLSPMNELSTKSVELMPLGLHTQCVIHNARQIDQMRTTLKHLATPLFGKQCFRLKLSIPKSTGLSFIANIITDSKSNGSSSNEFRSNGPISSTGQNIRPNQVNLCLMILAKL